MQWFTQPLLSHTFSPFTPVSVPKLELMPELGWSSNRLCKNCLAFTPTLVPKVYSCDVHALLWEGLSKANKDEGPWDKHWNNSTTNSFISFIIPNQFEPYVAVDYDIHVRRTATEFPNCPLLLSTCSDDPILFQLFPFLKISVALTQQNFNSQFLLCLHAAPNQH